MRPRHTALFTQAAAVAAVLAATAATPAAASTWPAAGSISPATLTLPSGPASIRGLADDATVDVFTGQAAYEVAIDVPRDAGGFAPAIAVQYEGALGNGPFGVGWSLRTPYIARSLRLGVPDYGPGDELELVGVDGGGPLVAAGDGTFRVRGRGQAIRVLPQGSGFVVTDADGVRYTMGLALNARQRSGAQVARWLCQEIRHVSGRTVSFAYAHDQGEVYHDAITWGPQGVFSVTFHRGPRADVVTSWRAGFEVVTAERVERIDVHAYGAVIRSYALGYEADFPLTRLREVVVTGRGGADHLPPITLDYGPQAPEGLTAVVQCANSLPNCTPETMGAWSLSTPWTTLLDVDADGLADMVSLLATGHAWRRNLGGHFGVAQPLPGGAGVALSAAQLMDMTGNARPELVRGQGGSDWEVLALEDGAWSGHTSWAGTGGQTLSALNQTFADVDGDGRTDLLRGASGGLQIRMNDGAGLEAWVTHPAPYGVSTLVPGAAGARFQDMNGDGLADAVQITASQINVYAGRGDGTFAAPYVISLAGTGIASQTTQSQLRLRDLNRDGVTDVVVISGAAVSWFPARPGGALLPGVVLTPPTQLSTDVVATVADINGNGSLDVVWSAATGTWALDLAGSSEAGMLTSIDNGLGQVSFVAYDATARLALEAELAGEPWAERLPISVPVVIEASHTLASGEPARVSTFDVREGFYDTGERRFGGFLEATKTAEGGSPEATLEERSLFLSGFGDDRVLRGKAWRVEQRDGAGALLRAEETDWTALALTALPNAPGLRVPVATSQRTYHHEGHVTPVETRVDYTFDGEGNVQVETRLGRVDSPGDEVVTTRTWASNDTTWVRSRLVTEVIAEADGTVRQQRRTRYDGSAAAPLPVGQVSHGWARRTEGYLQDQGRWVLLEASDYDWRGNQTRAYQEGVWRDIDYSSDGVYMTAESVELSPGDVLTWSVTMDAQLGRPATSTDPNGVVTTYAYDGLGRVTSVAVGAASPHTTYAYEWSAPRPRVTTTHLDATIAPRVEVAVHNSAAEPLYTARRLDAGAWIVMEWTERDPRGELALRADPFEWPSAALPTALPATATGNQFAHDALGRRLSETLATGYVTSTGHARLQKTVAPGGLSAMTYTEDGQGRVVRAERKVGGVVEATTTSYDAVGRITRFDLQDGQAIHTWAYDTLGRVVAADDPDIGPRSYTWDDADRLLTDTNAEGETVSYTWDAAGRMIARTDGASTYTYHYDTPHSSMAPLQPTSTCKSYGGFQICGAFGAPAPAPAPPQNTRGRVAWIEEPTGFVTVRYDEHGHQVEVRRTIEGEQLITHMGYSADGLLKWADNDRGLALARSYDGAGRLIAVPGVWEAEALDARGRVLRERYGNGVIQHYERDLLGQEKAIRVEVPGVGASSGASCAGHCAGPGPGYACWCDSLCTGYGDCCGDYAQQCGGAGGGVGPADTVYDVKLKRSANGVLGSVADYDGVGLDHSAWYGHDGALRVTTAYMAGQYFQYGYDGLQNMTHRTRTAYGAGPVPAMLSGSYLYGQGGAGPRQLTSVGGHSYTYDDAGRVVDDGAVGLQWDAFDRLRLVTLPGALAVQHRYGHDGARAYTLDPWGHEERHFGTEAVDLDGRLDSWVVVGGRPVARVSQLTGGGVERQYLHVGPSGAPALVTDEAGLVIDERRYEPFGAAIDGDPGVERLGFDHKLIDPSTGYADHGARWMSSAAARWLAPDPPVRTPDPAFARSPWDLHPYQFVANSPVLYSDPDGRAKQAKSDWQVAGDWLWENKWSVADKVAGKFGYGKWNLVEKSVQFAARSKEVWMEVTFGWKQGVKFYNLVGWDAASHAAASRIGGYIGALGPLAGFVDFNTQVAGMLWEHVTLMDRAIQDPGHCYLNNCAQVPGKTDYYWAQRKQAEAAAAPTQPPIGAAEAQRMADVLTGKSAEEPYVPVFKRKTVSTDRAAAVP